MRIPDFKQRNKDFLEKCRGERVIWRRRDKLFHEMSSDDRGRHCNTESRVTDISPSYSYIQLDGSKSWLSVRDVKILEILPEVKEQ